MEQEYIPKPIFRFPLKYLNEKISFFGTYISAFELTYIVDKDTPKGIQGMPIFVTEIKHQKIKGDIISTILYDFVDFDEIPILHLENEEEINALEKKMQQKIRYKIKNNFKIDKEYVNSNLLRYTYKRKNLYLLDLFRPLEMEWQSDKISKYDILTQKIRKEDDTFLYEYILKETK